MIARIIFLTLLFGLVSVGAVRAQDVATPDEPADCTTEPRTVDEIATIQAMPAADSTPVAASDASEPVDDETLAEIELALRTAEACARAGDYERLAGSYSDEAIANGALDAEGIPIEVGTPEATPASAPQPGKFAPTVVLGAVRIDERHVVAQIKRGSTVREVRLVLEDGRWLIDSTETVIETIDEGGVATPDQSAVLPIAVLQAVVDLVAAETGAAVTTVTIISVELEDWPDTFLGCPVEGAFAAQVITPGYRVVVQIEGEQLEIHTDLTGHAVTC